MQDSNHLSLFTMFAEISHYVNFFQKQDPFPLQKSEKLNSLSHYLKIANVCMRPGVKQAEVT